MERNVERSREPVQTVGTEIMKRKGSSPTCHEEGWIMSELVGLCAIYSREREREKKRGAAMWRKKNED